MTGKAVLQLDVFPYMHSVHMCDPNWSEAPEFETGEERVVANAQMITVSTREDLKGDVRIAVYKGPTADVSGELVYEGALMLTVPRLAVGSVLTEELREIEVGNAGECALQIYVDPPDDPCEIAIVILGDHHRL